MFTASLRPALSLRLSPATRLLLCACAGLLACSPDAEPDTDEAELAADALPTAEPDTQIAGAGEVVAKRVDVRDGRTYTRSKVRAADGSLVASLRDDQGRELASDDLPSFVREPLGPELARLLADGDARRAHDVLLVLRSDVEESATDPSTVRVELGDQGATAFEVDGAKASEAEVARLQDAMFDDLSARADARTARRQAAIQQLASRHGWDRDAALELALRAPQGFLARTLTGREIADVLATSGDLVEVIELASPAAPTIAAGLASINVDYWAHQYAGARGNGVGIFMGEAWGNCPVAPHIDPARFTNLTGAAEHWHADAVGNVLALTAPQAHIYCGSYMIANPTAYWPPIRVTNHSWRYTEEGNAYGGADRDFDDAVYNDRLAVFVAAGNVEANQTWNVASPGRGFNSLTVGNYDAANNTMNGGSRHINPNSGNEKPEIAAPGTNVGTSVGWATGTSLSAPFSAGFAADMMGQHTWLQGHPELLKAMMMAGATRNIEGAAALSALDGAGGINYFNTAYNGSVQWWVGPNNSIFDGANQVKVDRWLTAGQRYRMALTWLVPGSYAYSNNNVNMDLDTWVTDPNGSTVAGSYSYDNGFEIVDFVAPVSGIYKVTVNRYWNSGVGDVIMGHHTQAVY